MKKSGGGAGGADCLRPPISMRSMLCFEPPSSPARNLPTTKGTTDRDRCWKRPRNAATHREGSDIAKLAWRKRSRARKPKRIFDFTLHPDDLYFFLQNRKSGDEGERGRGRSKRSKLAATTSTSDYCKRPFLRSASLAPEPRRSEVSVHPRFEQAASESVSVRPSRLL